MPLPYVLERTQINIVGRGRAPVADNHRNNDTTQNLKLRLAFPLRGHPRVASLAASRQFTSRGTAKRWMRCIRRTDFSSYLQKTAEMLHYVQHDMVFYVFRIIVTADRIAANGRGTPLPYILERTQINIIGLRPASAADNHRNNDTTQNLKLRLAFPSMGRGTAKRWMRCMP